MERLLRIDGLRWLAALIVFFNHFTVVFWPDTFWGVTNSDYDFLVRFLHDTPAGLLVNGNFAVHIFFALSGFTLYLSWQSRAAAISVYTYVRRYLRLMLPTLGSILLAFILVATKRVYIDDLAPFTAESPWLLYYGSIEPNLFEAIYQGVYHVFFKFGQSAYNPVVWVLGFFWLGSVIIYTILASFKAKICQAAFFFVLAAMSLFFGLTAFWLGALLALLYSSPKIWTFLRSKFPVSAYLMLLPIVVVLGSYPTNYTGTVSNLYSYLELPYLGLGTTGIIYHILAASILLAIIVLDPRQFFSRTLNKLAPLGKYAYALYLTHALVLVSFSSWLWLKLRLLFSYNITTVIVLIASLIIVVPVYKLFNKFIEQTTLKLINSIVNR